MTWKEELAIVILLPIMLYGIAVLFVVAVSWVTGTEPANLIPGMLPYSEWPWK